MRKKQRFKSILLFFFTIIILLSSCRKKEVDNVKHIKDYVPSIEHCYNGIMDVDEKGEDCGGTNCVTCKQYISYCYKSIDTIITNNSNIPPNPIISKINDNDTYTFNLASGGFIRFLFDQQPSLTTIYEAEDFISSYSAKIEYKDSENGPLLGATGQVIINFENDNYSFSSCNLGILNSDGNQVSDIKFKLIVN